MTLTVLRPPPVRAASVELLWWYEGSVPAHRVELMLPTAAMQLVVNLRDDETLVGDGVRSPRFERLGSAVLGGPTLQPFVIPTAQQRACAGVVFRPGRAFPFLGKQPAGALLNRHASLDELWGAAAEEFVAAGK